MVNYSLEILKSSVQETVLSPLARQGDRLLFLKSFSCSDEKR